jgi:hypothetical protein
LKVTINVDELARLIEEKASTFELGEGHAEHSKLVRQIYERGRRIHPDYIRNNIRFCLTAFAADLACTLRYGGGGYNFKTEGWLKCLMGGLHGTIYSDAYFAVEKSGSGKVLGVRFKSSTAHQEALERIREQGKRLTLGNLAEEMGYGSDDNLSRTKAMWKHLKKANLLEWYHEEKAKERKKSPRKRPPSKKRDIVRADKLR